MKQSKNEHQKKFILNNPVFSDEIKDFIISKGFQVQVVDNYCQCALNIDTSPNAYFHVIGYVNEKCPVKAYIFNEGIGVDIYSETRSYDINNFWKFSDYDGFEDVYNRMNYFIKDYCNPQF